MKNNKYKDVQKDPIDILAKLIGFITKIWVFVLIVSIVIPRIKLILYFFTFVLITTVILYLVETLLYHMWDNFSFHYSSTHLETTRKWFPVSKKVYDDHAIINYPFVIFVSRILFIFASIMVLYNNVSICNSVVDTIRTIPSAVLNLQKDILNFITHSLTG